MAQTSIHIRPCKESAERHNYRKKELDYVRKELTQFNKNWIWKAGAHLADRREEIKKLVKEKTGRKMQAKAQPLQEGVVVIKQSTKMEDLKRIAARFKEEFGIECIHISMHKDEGHWVHKGTNIAAPIAPNEHLSSYSQEYEYDWKGNYHAHMVFDWYDHNTGKSYKLRKDAARKMQSICAEELGMERGVSSDKHHEDSKTYKTRQQVREIKKIEQGLKEREKAVEEKERTTAEKEKAADKKIQEKKQELFDINKKLDRDREDAQKELDEIKKTILSLQKEKKELQEEKKAFINDFKENQEKSFQIWKDVVNARSEFDSINSSIEKQKAVRTQINAQNEALSTQIEEKRTQLQRLNQDTAAKTLQLEGLNKALANFKDTNQSTYEAYNSYQEGYYDFGDKAYNVAAEVAERMASEFRKRADFIANLGEKAIGRILDYVNDGARRTFNYEDYEIFNSLFGNENREEKAEWLIKLAEKRIGSRIYAGQNIVRHDLMEIARGNEVRLENGRGRGIGY